MDKKNLMKLHKQLSVSLATVEQMLVELGSPAPTEAPEKPDVITGSTETVQKPPQPPKPTEAKRELSVDIHDPDWPIALPESVIVRSDSQKWARANTILTKFEKIKGPVLDFGCGEGHTTISLRDLGSDATGYDIKDHESWVSLSSDGVFTTDWDIIQDKGPFQSVLFHDVVDHVENESIEDVMQKINSVLVDNGRVYVMAHPYSSRHGGHLYEVENKAYLHMLLDDDKIKEIYPDIPPNQKIVKPQGNYQRFFTGSFTIEHKKVIPQSIEPWILTNLLPEIKERWYQDLQPEQVEKILQIGGIYYTLRKLPATI